MFEGLLNIARSMTKNITCSVQDASVLQGFDAELVDMTLEAAKAIADKPRPSPSPEAPGLPVRSDHILIDILIHLTQNVAEPRIIVFEHIWTHRVQDAFACLVILDSVTRYQCCVWCSAAEKLTPESCCKPRHWPEQTCRFFSNVSKLSRVKQVLFSLASNRCCGFGHETWTALPSTYGGSSAHRGGTSKCQVGMTIKTTRKIMILFIFVSVGR